MAPLFPTSGPVLDLTGRTGTGDGSQCDAAVSTSPRLSTIALSITHTPSFARKRSRSKLLATCGLRPQGGGGASTAPGISSQPPRFSSLTSLCDGVQVVYGLPLYKYLPPATATRPSFARPRGVAMLEVAQNSYPGGGLGYCPVYARIVVVCRHRRMPNLGCPARPAHIILQCFQGRGRDVPM